MHRWPHIPLERRPLMHPRMDRPDWNHLKAFLATAEAGSLSAAARRLGVSRQFLSQFVRRYGLGAR